MLLKTTYLHHKICNQINLQSKITWPLSRDQYDPVRNIYEVLKMGRSYITHSLLSSVPSNIMAQQYYGKNWRGTQLVWAQPIPNHPTNKNHLIPSTSHMLTMNWYHCIQQIKWDQMILASLCQNESTKSWILGGCVLLLSCSALLTMLGQLKNK